MAEFDLPVMLGQVLVMGILRQDGSIEVVNVGYSTEALKVLLQPIMNIALDNPAAFFPVVSDRGVQRRQSGRNPIEDFLNNFFKDQNERDNNPPEELDDDDRR